jgi:hypothetical protein
VESPSASLQFQSCKKKKKKRKEKKTENSRDIRDKVKKKIQ